MSIEACDPDCPCCRRWIKYRSQLIEMIAQLEAMTVRAEARADSAQRQLWDIIT